MKFRPFCNIMVFEVANLVNPSLLNIVIHACLMQSWCFFPEVVKVFSVSAEVEVMPQICTQLLVEVAISKRGRSKM